MNISFSIIFSNRRYTLKMADQGRSDFYVAFTMSLCALELKTDVHKFAISRYKALKLGIQILRTYFQLICQYELHILPNTKVGAPKNHDGKTP